MNLKYILPAVATVVIIAFGLTFILDEQEQFSENDVLIQKPSESLTKNIEDETTLSVSEEKKLSSISNDENELVEDKIMITNGVKHLVPLNKIKSGGPPPDGIPSIDSPKFTKATNENHVVDSDLVIGLEINGEAKAYPLSILVWHEIVNDNVGGLPVAVTYCPLCFTNQVFERTIEGQEVEFGTSGKLYNSNLVMYDRLTGTYWSQAMGQAIKGELTGQKLNIIPFDVISWGDWKKLYPDTVVLTTSTGHIRAYGVDPYGDYYTDPRIIFPVEYRDDRLHPKEVILGFNEGTVSKAYQQKDVESLMVINDEINDKPILLVSFFPDNARAFDREFRDTYLEFVVKDNKIFDLQTNSEWNYDGLAIHGELSGTKLSRLGFNPGFWFEWVAFHPDTELYGD